MIFNSIAIFRMPPFLASVSIFFCVWFNQLNIFDVHVFFCLWHFCCILSCLAILIDLIRISHWKIHLYISTWHFWNLLYSTLNIYMPYENKNAIGSCRCAVFISFFYRFERIISVTKERKREMEITTILLSTVFDISHRRNFSTRISFVFILLF